MNFIIPMAGNGARFTEAGYQLPKMLLKAHGKTLLEWSLSSLPLHLADVIVFVGLKTHEENFHLQAFINERYSQMNCKFIFLNKVTRGQAETAYLALHLCKSGKPIVIYNIDTFFTSATIEDALTNRLNDGVLGSFKSLENRFSFAALDENSGYVTEVREKEVISENALTGLYTFRDMNDFIETYDYHIRNNLTVKGEYYIAPMYNYLIERGRKYIIDRVNKHHILGTPEEYNQFLNLSTI